MKKQLNQILQLESTRFPFIKRSFESSSPNSSFIPNTISLPIHSFKQSHKYADSVIESTENTNIAGGGGYQMNQSISDPNGGNTTTTTSSNSVSLFKQIEDNQRNLDIHIDGQRIYEIKCQQQSPQSQFLRIVPTASTELSICQPKLSFDVNSMRSKQSNRKLISKTVSTQPASFDDSVYQDQILQKNNSNNNNNNTTHKKNGSAHISSNSICTQSSNAQLLASPLVSAENIILKNVLFNNNKRMNKDSIHLSMKTYSLDKSNQLHRFEENLHKVKENLLSKSYSGFQRRSASESQNEDILMVHKKHQKSFLTKELNHTKKCHSNSTNGVFERIIKPIKNDESKSNNDDLVRIAIQAQSQIDKQMNPGSFFLAKRAMHFTQNPKVADILEQIDIHSKCAATSFNTDLRKEQLFQEILKFIQPSSLCSSITSQGQGTTAIQIGSPLKTEYKFCEERIEVQALQKWLDEMIQKTLQKQNSEFAGTFQELEQILHGAFQEAIRQVSQRCEERGKMLMKIWNTYNYLVSKMISMYRDIIDATSRDDQISSDQVVSIYKGKCIELAKSNDIIQHSLAIAEEKGKKMIETNFYLRKKLTRIEKEKNDLQSDNAMLQQEIQDRNEHLQNAGSSSIAINENTNMNYSRKVDFSMKQLTVQQKQLQLPSVSFKSIQSLENEIFLKNQEEKSMMTFEGIKEEGVNTDFHFYLHRKDKSTEIGQDRQRWITDAEIQCNLLDEYIIFENEGESSVKSNKKSNNTKGEATIGFTQENKVKEENIFNYYSNNKISINGSQEEIKRDLKGDVLKLFTGGRVSVGELKAKVTSIIEEQIYQVFQAQNKQAAVSNELEELRKRFSELQRQASERNAALEGKERKIEILEDKTLKCQMEINEQKKELEEGVIQIVLLQKRIKDQENEMKLLKNKKNNTNNHINSDTNGFNDSMSQQQEDSMDATSRIATSIKVLSAQEQNLNGMVHGISKRELRSSFQQINSNDNGKKDSLKIHRESSSKNSRHKKKKSSLYQPQQQQNQPSISKPKQRGSVFASFGRDTIKVQQKKSSIALSSSQNVEYVSSFQISSPQQMNRQFNRNINNLQNQQQQQSTIMLLTPPNSSSNRYQKNLLHIPQSSSQSPTMSDNSGIGTSYPQRENPQRPQVANKGMYASNSRSSRLDLLLNSSREAAETILNLARQQLSNQLELGQSSGNNGVQQQNGTDSSVSSEVDQKQVIQLLKIISQIYQEFLKALRKGDENIQPLIALLYDMFLHRFGVKKIAEKKLMDLLIQLRKAAENNKKIRVFSRILGLHGDQICQESLLFFGKCLLRSVEFCCLQQADGRSQINTIEKYHVSKDGIHWIAGGLFQNDISTEKIEQFVETAILEMNKESDNGMTGKQRVSIDLYQNAEIAQIGGNKEDEVYQQYEIDIVSEKMLSFHLTLQAAGLQKIKDIHRVFSLESSGMCLESFMVLMRGIGLKNTVINDIQLVELFMKYTDQASQGNGSRYLTEISFCKIMEEKGLLVNNALDYQMRMANNIQQNFLENKITNVLELKDNWGKLHGLLKGRLMKKHKDINNKLIAQLDAFITKRQNSRDGIGRNYEGQDDIVCMLLFRMLCEESRRTIVEYETDMILGKQFTQFADSLHDTILKRKQL